MIAVISRNHVKSTVIVSDCRGKDTDLKNCEHCNNVSEKVLLKDVEKHLSSIHFDDDLKSALAIRLKKQYEATHGNTYYQLEKNRNELADVEENQKKLLDLLIAGTVPADVYRSKNAEYETAKIEHEEDFQYYLDFTPSQGALVEALDAERMALGKAYGLELRTLVDEYKNTYETSGNNMYEVITNAVSAYTGIKGQKTMRTRYLMEDIPYSLVALQTMGQVAGVPTPCISAVITVARAIIPEMDEGRTRKNLGLEGVDKEAFEAMCREG